MRILLAESLAGPALLERLQALGYATDWIADAAEAEAQANIEPYDAIVLGLQRPDLEMLRRWRAHGLSVPVIVLATGDDWRERMEAFAAGADDCLPRPFHVDELLARLGAVLRRAHGAAGGGALTVDGVCLDEGQRHACDSHGDPVELTATEFRLLRYFMLNPGRVLSKPQLADHVYESDAEQGSNVLEVYVNRLRQKLGPQVIETRRGHGYVYSGRPQPPGRDRQG